MEGRSSSSQPCAALPPPAAPQLPLPLLPLLPLFPRWPAEPRLMAPSISESSVTFSGMIMLSRGALLRLRLEEEAEDLTACQGEIPSVSALRHRLEAI